MQITTIGQAERTVGYPAEQGYDGSKMYECLGNIVNSNNDNLMYNMDVACGQSGSPIFFDEGNGPYANGIVTHKTGLGYNIGYTITGDLIQWLKDNGFVN